MDPVDWKPLIPLAINKERVSTTVRKRAAPKEAARGRVVKHDENAFIRLLEAENALKKFERSRKRLSAEQKAALQEECSAAEAEWVDTLELSYDDAPKEKKKRKSVREAEYLAEGTKLIASLLPSSNTLTKSQRAKKERKVEEKTALQAENTAQQEALVDVGQPSKDAGATPSSHTSKVENKLPHNSTTQKQRTQKSVGVSKLSKNDAFHQSNDIPKPLLPSCVLQQEESSTSKLPGIDPNGVAIAVDTLEPKSFKIIWRRGGKNEELVKKKLELAEANEVQIPSSKQTLKIDPRLCTTGEEFKDSIRTLYNCKALDLDV